MASRSTLQEEVLTRSLHLPNQRVVDRCELIEAIRRALTPSLGSLEYLEDDNRLVIKDIKSVIAEIESTIHKNDPRARVALLASTWRKAAVSIAEMPLLSQLRDPEALLFLEISDVPSGSVIRVSPSSARSPSRGEVWATQASTIGVHLHIRYPIVVY